MARMTLPGGARPGSEGKAWPGSAPEGASEPEGASWPKGSPTLHPSPLEVYIPVSKGLLLEWQE